MTDRTEEEPSGRDRNRKPGAERQFMRPYTSMERGAVQPMASWPQANRLSPPRPAFRQVTLHRRDQTERKKSQLNRRGVSDFPPAWHQELHTPDRTLRDATTRRTRC